MAVLIILIICMIAMLVGSVFSIFLSDDPVSVTGKTISGVIAEIDAEYTDKITAIIDDNAYDILDVSEEWAEWKQTLAVYTVKMVTNPNNPMEVATMNDEKSAILKTVFWNMNTINHTLINDSEKIDVIGSDGLPTGVKITVTKKVLRIIVNHKTTDEIAIQYGFTNEQVEWLFELLKSEYDGFWNSFLYEINIHP